MTLNPLFIIDVLLHELCNLLSSVRYIENQKELVMKKLLIGGLLLVLVVCVTLLGIFSDKNYYLKVMNLNTGKTITVDVDECAYAFFQDTIHQTGFAREYHGHYVLASRQYKDTANLVRFKVISTFTKP